MNTDFSLDKGLPSSPETEKAILGAILQENDLWRKEAVDLESSDFFLDSHRRIFSAMAAMSDAGKPIEVMSLAVQLGDCKELDAIGGYAYLSSLTDGLPRRSSIAHYISIVRGHAALRNLIYAANGMISCALQAPADEAARVIADAQSACTALAMQAASTEKELFVDVTEFCSGPDVKPDWIVEGLIERGSNGMAAADPKGGKSLTFAAYLSVCLALGQSWLGLNVYGRTRVAVVSREDNPSTTKRRIKQIVKGKGASLSELEGYLHINSKKQSPSLMLDNPREVNNLIRCIQRWRSQFVILDVFNKMHSQDENDNTKIRMVMNQVDRIYAETGAQMCVLHHWNKSNEKQSLVRRARGAGSISGFAEWMAGIEVVDETNQIRKMTFETKVGGFLKPIHYQVEESADESEVYFRLVEPEV